MNQPTSPRFGFGLFLYFLIVLAIMGSTWPSEAFAQNLEDLFAPATGQDFSNVHSDWSHRPDQPTSAAIDRTATLDGFRMDRISFDFDGLHQYGLLRYPRHYTPGDKFPVLMYLHGGFNGLWYQDPLHFDDDFPSTCVADSFFVVCPTYRGEALSGGELGNVFSEGPTSVWNRDTDDSMAMLTAVLDLVDGPDPLQVMALGQSRGGTVAYQMLVRDPRVSRTVVLFGPSQFRMPSIQSELQAHLDGTAEVSGPLAGKVLEEIIEPWVAGEIDLAEARHWLTIWSICDFLPEDIILQTHHGLADESVLPEQSYMVSEHMSQFDGGVEGFTLHTYDNGQHNPSTLHGYEELVEELLCSFQEPISSVPDFRDTGLLQAWPNPFTGQLRVRADDPAKNLSPVKQLYAEVFNLRGHRVSQFVLEPGVSITWQAKDSSGRPLPAGQYSLRILNNPQFPVQRILLLR